MQIHEITKRKINEASALGAVGGAGSVLGGIANQVGKSLMSKAFGGTDVMGKTTGGVMDRADALKMGQELSRSLMPVMMKNWGQKVQAAIMQSKDPAGNPATSIQQLTPDSQNTLKTELDLMIGRAIQPRGGFDYNKLEQHVGADPLAKSQAQVISQAIAKAADGIYQNTLSGGNTEQAWQSLMTNGIAPAQGVLAYDAGTGSVASKPRFGTDANGATVISIDNAPFVKYEPHANAEHKAINDRMLAGKL
jgi:hypothetical protein